METMWSNKKILAISLRQKGYSIRRIESELKISRSTLSGWFKNIILTKKQKMRLEKNRLAGLIKARRLAVRWHNNSKKQRIELAEKEGEDVLNSIKLKNNILDIILAMLYLGEGSKKAEETSMGNSDPLILKTFLTILKNNYKINEGKIRCELYLRADQDLSEIKKFWSKELNLPLSNFKYAHFDKRTSGSPTRKNYKGVCMIRYGNVAIKRKLMYISKKLCEKIIDN